MVTSPTSSRLLIVGIEAHSTPTPAFEFAFKKYPSVPTDNLLTVSSALPISMSPFASKDDF